MDLLDFAKQIAAEIAKYGGRTFTFGGYVRDLLLFPDIPPKDLDLEVYNIELTRLKQILEKFGKVSEVGKAFGVFKIGNLDISVPRQDFKIGLGHKGFQVQSNPFLSIPDAARRRDLTINSIGMDLLTSEIIDPFKGQADLENRVLRATDLKTFGEDPLRVLRVVQFSARFDFEIEPKTLALCQTIDLSELPVERVELEFEKLLLLSRRPSIGFRNLDRMAALRFFPELERLKGCPQENAWHPEGDVFEHTLLVMDEAAKLRDQWADPDKRIVFMLAAVCHDFGKPLTTEIRDNRIRSYKHEKAGIKPTQDFLNRITRKKAIIDAVSMYVAHHLLPHHLYANRVHVKVNTIKKLAAKIEIPFLIQLALADFKGTLSKNDFAAGEWLYQKYIELSLDKGVEKPLLMGRHLIKQLQLSPGPEFSRILKTVYDLQLKGEVKNLEEALSAARKLAVPNK